MILTHCSRLKDFGHTSYAEMLAFKEILEQNLIFRSVEIRDHEDLKSVAYLKSMTIFAAGQDMNQTIVELANSCDNLYIVVQDPNWPTSLGQINKDFHLITPFRALENLDLDEVKRILKKYIPTLEASHIKSHSVVDFGSMLAYNQSYVNRYLSQCRDSRLRTIKGWPCYVGSLKKDRIHLLSEIAKNRSLSFFGNFTREDFKRMSKLTDSEIEDCKFFGRIDSDQVVRVYHSHDGVVFCPDDKIFDLDTSYLRIGEMCLARTKVTIVTTRKDVNKSLDHLKDSTGRLSWEKFVKSCHERNLLSQIKKAYGAVLT